MAAHHLNDAVRLDINNSVLCWLASVDADGMPNVSPKQTFLPYGDDLILIGEIASPVSLANIQSNNKVCVSFVDVFRKRGFKIKGEAAIVASGDPRFAEWHKVLQAKVGPDFLINQVIAITILTISRIWAPSYKVYPSLTEAERMESAFADYGGLPANQPQQRTAPLKMGNRPG